LPVYRESFYGEPLLGGLSEVPKHFNREKTLVKSRSYAKIKILPVLRFRELIF